MLPRCAGLEERRMVLVLRCNNGELQKDVVCRIVEEGLVVERLYAGYKIWLPFKVGQDSYNS